MLCDSIKKKCSISIKKKKIFERNSAVPAMNMPSPQAPTSTTDCIALAHPVERIEERSHHLLHTNIFHKLCTYA